MLDTIIAIYRMFLDTVTVIYMLLVSRSLMLLDTIIQSSIKNCCHKMIKVSLESITIIKMLLDTISVIKMLLDTIITVKKRMLDTVSVI